MSQTRQLEVLRQKRREGKFPSVKVSGEDYEFIGVQFGGASPTVSLAAPSGETKTRSVADWKRIGAEFSARSRSLPRSYVHQSSVGAPASQSAKPKTDAELAKDIRDYLAPEWATDGQKIALGKIMQAASENDVEIAVIPPRHGRGNAFQVKLTRGSTRGNAVNVGPNGEIRHAEFSTGHDRAIEQMIAKIGAR